MTLEKALPTIASTAELDRFIAQATRDNKRFDVVQQKAIQAKRDTLARMFR